VEAGTRSGGASTPGPHHTGEKTSPPVHHQIQGRQVSNFFDLYFVNTVKIPFYMIRIRYSMKYKWWFTVDRESFFPPVQRQKEIIKLCL
jgi:hypothetical protein